MTDNQLGKVAPIDASPGGSWVGQPEGSYDRLHLPVDLNCAFVIRLMLKTAPVSLGIGEQP
ncbi:hypothetical protein [Mycobacterium sp.]|uniref:hypothetical protein n=1 Tax=Mycobacterium sp. TaxID=1785 RepID=UPI0031E2FD44